jgi:hypothetical protein
LEGINTVQKTVVGQVLEISNDGWDQVITIETPLGDVVYLTCPTNTAGTTPYVGGVYAISYVVQDGTLRVSEIRKPAPGQYRAEFEKGPAPKPRPTMSSSPRSRRAPPPKRTYAPVYTSESPRPWEVHARGGSYAPTTSILKGVRPSGVALISIFLLLIGGVLVPFGFVLSTASIYFALFAWIYGGIGFVALLLGWGLYTYREWARTGVIILGIILCISLIGIVIGGPMIWYLEQSHIKRMYVF